MSLSLADRVAHALVDLTPDHPNALPGLRPLYANALVFRDPIQVAHGLDAFVALNKRLLRRMRRLEWKIVSTRGDASEAFVEWVMLGAPKLGPSIEVNGVSRVLARDGLIYDQRDYWDMGEMFASSVPGGQKILQVLRAPFA